MRTFASSKRFPLSLFPSHPNLSFTIGRFWLTQSPTIRYLPDGNSKFGALSISTPPASEQSLLHYRLFIDGKEAWSYTLTAPPDVHGGSGRAKDAIWG